MAMGNTIGKSLLYGFAGNYSRQPDSVIASHVLKGDTNVNFGDPVYLNENDNNRSVIAIDSDFTADLFIGIATAEIRSAVTVDNMDGVYRNEDMVPVMSRGVVSVICQRGIPLRGAPVYVRISNPPANGKIGGFEADSDGSDNVMLDNCIWTSEADSNGIAEIRIRTINLI